MDKRQRIAMQRALIREAFGKIEAATELFGIEDGAVSVDDPTFDEWEAKVQDFQDWVFGKSPIA